MGMMEKLLVEKIAVDYWRLKRLLRYESGEILGRTHSFKAEAIERYLNPPMTFLEPEKPGPSKLTYYSYESEISDAELTAQNHLVYALGYSECDLTTISNAVEEIAYDLQEEIDDPTVEELLQAKKHIKEMTPEKRKTLRDRLYKESVVRLYEMKEARKMQVKFDQISRIRCIPAESDLAKIQKYEVMLERSIFQNLAILQALQKNHKKLPTRKIGNSD